MYHPSRGGVRGGRDQFSWEDVKADKHRENYLGHSIKAPVGRWQKGKDLHWYARDKKTAELEMEAAKEEIRRVKEQEEQAMREALGLAPKSSSRQQGNRLDKHELSELVKRGTTAEDLGEGHAEAVRVHGLGFSRLPHNWEGESSSITADARAPSLENVYGASCKPTSKNPQEEVSEDASKKKRRREDGKRDRPEKRSHDSDKKRKHKREKSRRHDSD